MTVLRADDPNLNSTCGQRDAVSLVTAFAGRWMSPCWCPACGHELPGGASAGPCACSDVTGFSTPHSALD